MNDEEKPRSRRKCWIWGAVIVVVAFALGAAGGAGWAGWTAWRHFAGPGMGMFGYGMGMHDWGEPRRGHMAGFAGRWLDRVDATDEQHRAVNDILDRMVTEVADEIEEHRGLGREWLEVLGRPELDAAAMEALRAKHVAFIDRESRRMLALVIEVGEVLTPEQRKELVSRVERYRAHREERSRGWWRR